MATIWAKDTREKDDFGVWNDGGGSSFFASAMMTTTTTMAMMERTAATTTTTGMNIKMMQESNIKTTMATTTMVITMKTIASVGMRTKQQSTTARQLRWPQ